MPLPNEQLRLLYEIGLMAASTGDAARAEKIFAALERVKPQGCGGYVGRAVGLMFDGKLIDALAILDKGLRLADASEHPELHAFRGLVLQVAGRSAESTKAFLAAGDLPMARALLGEVDPPAPEPARLQPQSAL